MNSVQDVLTFADLTALLTSVRRPSGIGGQSEGGGAQSDEDGGDDREDGRQGRALEVGRQSEGRHLIDVSLRPGMWHRPKPEVLPT